MLVKFICHRVRSVDVTMTAFFSHKNRDGMCVTSRVRVILIDMIATIACKVALGANTCV